MSKINLPSARAASDVKHLGRSIEIARKRRQFTQQRLADGAGLGRATVRRLEGGDPGVSIGALAMVLLALGETGRLTALLDVARDDIGLVISINDLPQRVRAKTRSKSAPAVEGAGRTADVPREPEAF